jgi:hypothetical protein
MTADFVFRDDLENILRDTFLCDVCTLDDCRHWATGDEANGTFLTDSLVKQVNLKWADWNLQESQISLEEEKELFTLAMCNFDLLVCFARNLKYLSPRLKYVIISRVMYFSGSCGIPEDLDDGYVELLSSNNQTYWHSNPDGAYWLREKVLNDPNIGAEPLVDEFQSTDSISMLTTLMENPAFPREILIEIANGSHNVLENHDANDADQLLNCAKEMVLKHHNLT